MRRDPLVNRLAARQYAEHEHQLPGGGVEVPEIVVDGRQVIADLRRKRPQHDARAEQEPRLCARERQHQRHGEREERVHRQHRGEVRLALEQQDIRDGSDRRAEETVEIAGREIRRGAVERPQHEAREQHQRGGDEKRAVDFERALDEAAARDALRLARRQRCIRGRRREAAEEDEDFGGVVQCERVQREARQHAAADVIDDDDEQDKTTKEVEFGEALRFSLHAAFG